MIGLKVGFQFLQGAVCVQADHMLAKEMISVGSNMIELIDNFSLGIVAHRAKRYLSTDPS